MKRIGSYVNGNTIVAIYEDGTKERYTPDGEPAMPDFPESIDLKITNRCDLMCPMCAERSGPNGAVPLLNHPILDTLMPYTELAIGGGNPIEHPCLVSFLERMKDQKVICNMTVNIRHFMIYHNFLKALIDQGLIHGLGISIPNEISPGFFDVVKDFPTAVIHTIAGCTPINVFQELCDRNLNLLILGYKHKGYGIDYSQFKGSYLPGLIDEVADLVRSDLKRRFKAIAFDNLAVKQLRLQETMPLYKFEKLYMGDDGEYTMYIDLVTGTYGKSSTHPMHKIDGETIVQLFDKLHHEYKNDVALS